MAPLEKCRQVKEYLPFAPSRNGINQSENVFIVSVSYQLCVLV
jgi:hypothetical protein